MFLSARSSRYEKNRRTGKRGEIREVNKKKNHARMPRDDHIWTKKREWGSVGCVGSSTAHAQSQISEQRDLWITLVFTIFFFFFKVGANTSKENFILLASDIIMRAEVQIFQLQMNEGNPSCLRSAPENTTWAAGRRTRTGRRLN